MEDRPVATSAAGAGPGLSRTLSLAVGYGPVGACANARYASSIIKNDAYAINDEVRYLKGKLLDQGRAPTNNNPSAGAAAF